MALVLSAAEAAQRVCPMGQRQSAMSGDADTAALLSVDSANTYGTVEDVKVDHDSPPAPAAADRPKEKYRPDIDGLRAVAVLAVVIFHIDRSWLPGGFLGVDTFFVISGYVVTGSLMHNTHSSAGEYFAAFYGRRLKRLTPALCLFVAITATLLLRIRGFDLGFHDMDTYLFSGQLSTIGGANILFAQNEATYVPRAEP